VKTLHAKIGELALGHDFLSGALGKAGLLSRCTAAHACMRESGAQKMIDRTSKLSVSRQAGVLGISRGSVYYQPRPVSDANMKLMHRIQCPLLGHFQCPVRQWAGFCEANAERGQAAHGISICALSGIAAQYPAGQRALGCCGTCWRKKGSRRAGCTSRP
jgi:hypothetical protein